MVPTALSGRGRTGCKHLTLHGDPDAIQHVQRQVGGATGARLQRGVQHIREESGLLQALAGDASLLDTVVAAGETADSGARKEGTRR